MTVIQLSQQLVRDAACPPTKRKRDVYDATCKGLILEVRATGGKTYYLRYQDKRGKTRQIRLAKESDVSLQQARQLADKARNKIAMGVDPCEEKAAVKAVPTFAQFAARYLEFAKGYKRSWKTDESFLRNHLLPRFGKKYLDEITRDDVLRMHRARLEEGPNPAAPTVC